MRKLLPFILCVLIMVSCKTEGPVHTALNLDFETSIPESDIPHGWFWRSYDYELIQDYDTKQSGNASLRVKFIEKLRNDSGFFVRSMPLDSVKGRKIELTGYIKTEGITEGYAGLWLRVDDGEQGDYKVLGFDNMYDRGIKYTTDWTLAKIEMDVDAEAKDVIFGGLLTGNGTAWFDNLEIFIDGKKYEDIVLSTPKSDLTRSEKKELRKYIYPLRTFEPDGGDTNDLMVLDQLVGDSKVVALGEVTHGSSEIFKMKNRIIQYLAENKGFDIFSIEANMPESYKLNEYTIEGKGDPKSLIAGMYFWTWNTEEVLNMVEWMKTYNQGQPKISFTGFDMQFYEGPIRELKNFFLKEEKISSTITLLGTALKEIEMNLRNNHDEIGEEDIKKISELLKVIREDVDNLPSGVTKKAWLLQNIRIIEQFKKGITPMWRDKCMTENLLWIKEQNPSSKIVVWAHNAHIMKGNKTMGEHLADSLKNDYVPFDFAFNGGSYTASGKRGLTRYKAQPAYPGTLEYYLNLVDEPIFILDLKKIKSEGGESLRFITDNLKFRYGGMSQIDIQFFKSNTFDNFDYLIFIKESTPSKLLK